MVKSAGGIFVPASDLDADSLTRFQTGATYPVNVKSVRNPDFHGKVFAFFQFCFQYWASGDENLTSRGQFEVFRKHLTVIAGYYDQYFNLKGEVRTEAKSLEYGAMDQAEFEQFYVAATNAAMRTIFRGCGDDVYKKLIGFF